MHYSAEFLVAISSIMIGFVVVVVIKDFLRLCDSAFPFLAAGE